MARIAFRLHERNCPVDALARERRLRKLAGVAAFVHPANDTAYVTFDPAQLDAVAIGRAIEAAGSPASGPARGASALTRAEVTAIHARSR